MVEVDEADERVKLLTVGGQRPLIDTGELGLGGAIAGAREVVTDVFEARLEEVAFVEFQR